MRADSSSPEAKLWDSLFEVKRTDAITLLQSFTPDSLIPWTQHTLLPRAVFLLLE